MEIGGRMFCLMTLDGEWDFFNIKVEPEYGCELREKYPGIRPGYHMNKRHWVSVDFHGGVPDALMEKLIVHSYCQTARKLPKKLQARPGMAELLESEWRNRQER